MNRQAAISVLAVSLAAPGLAAAGSLSVTVDGVRGSDGRVLVAVCTEDDFVVDSCREAVAVDARDGAVSAVFPSLPPGIYAAKAFHDANGNGRLDTDWLGIPVEGYGLSNDPPKDRRPGFAASAFTVDATPAAIRISLFYR